MLLERMDCEGWSLAINKAALRGQEEEKKKKE